MKPLLHIRVPEEAGFYDSCINNSPVGTIYALSWYLNIVCPEWEILTTEDRSTVMPLPLKKSFGRKVVYQPAYAWQLGVFSTRIPSPEIIQHFIKSIPREYRIRQLCLNKFNLLNHGRIRIMNSAEMDLIQSYDDIRAGYGPAFRNKLRMAGLQPLSYASNLPAHDMLMFSHKFDRFNPHRLKPSEISLLRLVITNAIRHRAGNIIAAYDSHNNLCASMAFLAFKGRVSILHTAASREGIVYGGIEFLIDRFFNLNAGQNLVLTIDNPEDRKLMEILKCCGCSISTYCCLRG